MFPSIRNHYLAFFYVSASWIPATLSSKNEMNSAMGGLAVPLSAFLSTTPSLDSSAFTSGNEQQSSYSSLMQARTPAMEMKKSVCGDGVLDEDEECEPALQGPCCSKTCHFISSDTRSFCTIGKNKRVGTCYKGKCIDSPREMQCAALNQSMAVLGAVMFPPFSPCQDSPNNRTSIRGSFRFASSCSVQCRASSTNDPLVKAQCVNFNNYINAPMRVVTDGSLCSLPDSPIAALGICHQGQCNPNACRKFRCMDHGSCYLGSNRDFSCQCDEGYTGRFCEITSSCRTLS